MSSFCPLPLRFFSCHKVFNFVSFKCPKYIVCLHIFHLILELLILFSHSILFRNYSLLILFKMFFQVWTWASFAAMPIHQRGLHTERSTHCYICNSASTVPWRFSSTGIFCERTSFAFQVMTWCLNISVKEMWTFKIMKKTWEFLY